MDPRFNVTLKILTETRKCDSLYISLDLHHYSNRRRVLIQENLRHAIGCPRQIRLTSFVISVVLMWKLATLTLRPLGRGCYLDK